MMWWWRDTGMTGWAWALLLTCVLALWALVAYAAACLIQATPNGKMAPTRSRHDDCRSGRDLANRPETGRPTTTTSTTARPQ
ncbi:hypothetical protein [Flexivirga alba]|uniref:Secreted protein n=1 Tax=Flexivirga alba TaxID=702742 RepID=A0ABW2AJU7_9MICO